MCFFEASRSTRPIFFSLFPTNISLPLRALPHLASTPSCSPRYRFSRLPTLIVFLLLLFALFFPFRQRPPPHTRQTRSFWVWNLTSCSLLRPHLAPHRRTASSHVLCLAFRSPELRALLASHARSLGLIASSTVHLGTGVTLRYI